MAFHHKFHHVAPEFSAFDLFRRRHHAFCDKIGCSHTTNNLFLGTDSQVDEATQNDNLGSKIEKFDSACLFTPAQHDELKGMIEESMKRNSHTTNQVSSISSKDTLLDPSNSGKFSCKSLNLLFENAKSGYWVLETRATDHSWKPRLIERFSPERERITWEGEILDYTGGFSPERELSRLGEKWQFWAVDTGYNFEEKREKRAFQEQGALGIILELEKSLEIVSQEWKGLWVDS
ncbi:hypothetical protein Lal_00035963 [Lupinus albus]|nr:hypothetical protein Lal_00035963 [Lupinus albus]